MVSQATSLLILSDMSGRTRLSLHKRIAIINANTHDFEPFLDWTQTLISHRSYGSSWWDLEGDADSALGDLPFGASILATTASAQDLWSNI